MRRPDRRFLLAGVRLLLALGAPLLSPGGSSAATFGVPITGTAADGWFVLVGKDALGEDQSNYFGDVTRELDLNIEVTGTQLRVCIYDPGVFDPSRGGNQLDFQFQARDPLCPPTQMSYELYAPGNPVAIKRDDTTFGPDTAGGGGTDRKLWCLYDSTTDGPVAPGVYSFVARMVDGPCVDEDVNLFGVSIVPDEYDAYAWYATVGHSAFSNATLANGTVRLFPWAAVASPGQDTTGPVCGLDVVTYDLDGSTFGATPPAVTLTTTQGFADPAFGASLDGGFHGDSWPDMAPYNAGDDHGIYQVEFSALGDPVLEKNRLPSACLPSACPAGGIDFNAFSFQLYNYGAAAPAFFTDYPVSPGHPRMTSHNPRRIYLPHQNGIAPAKEYVGHKIVNPPAGGGYPVNVKTQVDVELRIENPTAYDLTNVVGRTRTSAAPEVSVPRTIAASAGGTATLTGRRIDFSFPIVPALGRSTVTYTVDFTPTAAGPFFLTGDGTDFVGGGRPTNATWDTPFVTGEQGMPCMIQANVVVPPCSVTAAASAPPRVCSNDPIPLDGSASAGISCPGGQLEYRWTGPGLPPSPPFTTTATASVSGAPAGADAYTLEARCQADTSCQDTATATVTVSAAERPVADAGPDRAVLTCDVPFTIGSPGDPVKFTYAWSPGNLVSSAAVPQPSFTQTAPGTYDLTLDVTAIADATCAAQDTLRVLVASGAPTGVLGNRLKAARSAGNVVLSWPLGLILADRYNLHRTAVKTDLDRANYRAPVVNPASPIFTGGYSDPLTASPALYHYQVYGRDCAGASVIN